MNGTAYSRSFAFIRGLSLPLLCFFAGCSHKPSGGVQRLAVSRFENLSGDPSLDWTRIAVPTVLVAELPNVVQAASAPAGQRLEGYISTVGDQLRISAFLLDSASNKTADNFIVRGPIAGGILPLASAVAHHFDPRARPYSTGNPEALKIYVEALEQKDPAAITAGLEHAVSLDPNFGTAYVSWCELLANRGDRAGAGRVIELARQRGKQILEPDRARLETMAAFLTGDAASEIRAMTALSRLTPGDAGLLARIGDANVQQRQYGAAVEAYRKAAAIEPSNEVRLNQLGYAQCWAHDLEGARETLLKYQKLKPNDANPLDSLGDVHYRWGRFADAEKYYLQASEKDPSFLGGGDLLKAARARLMTGDIAGADQIYQKYAAARRTGNDSLIEYRQAQWDFLCGRRKPAMDRLGNSAAPVSLAQLAIWYMETGDATRAREYASRAAAAAQDPASKRQAALSGYLAAPKTPAAQWFPAPQEAMLRKIVSGYALLFTKQFSDAQPVFKELFDKAAPSDPAPYGILLAWTLIETGRSKEATDLLTPFPLPNAAGLDPLESVAFPRVFQLRAGVLGQRGRTPESLGYHQLFQKLSGDVPLIWDKK